MPGFAKKLVSGEGVDPRLVEAINLGSPDLARAAIAAGARVNPDQPVKRSPLMLALDASAPDDLVLALIEAGADLAEASVEINRRRMSPLRRACELGRLPVMRALLAAGASPDGMPGETTTPLHAAAWACHEALPVLLEAGAKPDERDDSSHTPYMVCALFNPQEEALRRLAEAGADPLALDSNGKTPLEMSAEFYSFQREGAQELRRQEEAAHLRRATEGREPRPVIKRPAL